MSEIKHKDWMNRLVGGCTYVYDSKQWHRSLNIQEFSKMSRSLGLSAVTPKDKIHTNESDPCQLGSGLRFELRSPNNPILFKARKPKGLESNAPMIMKQQATNSDYFGGVKGPWANQADQGRRVSSNHNDNCVLMRYNRYEAMYSVK
ncbi:predicted protein [Coccidioides posadasii str. Silveira]|uniref:Predicted protein n=1 Tax=Coccidioides posadasii (strain RMSCC 757 / Silveira) TaxID=443226 RepID=E9CS83_COCPS|nr:predicted protein [Coccidioides posadasii str. Silveira]